MLTDQQLILIINAENSKPCPSELDKARAIEAEVERRTIERCEKALFELSKFRREDFQNAIEEAIDEMRETV